jgi:hypothetical protein
MSASNFSSLTGLTFEVGAQEAKRMGYELREAKRDSRMIPLETIVVPIESMSALLQQV